MIEDRCQSGLKFCWTQLRVRFSQWFVPGLFLALALAFPDTSMAQLFRFGKQADPVPIVFSGTPSRSELVQHIDSIHTKFAQLSADLRISLDGTPKLRGTLQLEPPRRLRIKAGVLGVSQLGVDVGSNEQNFWVWTKVNLPNQRPAIFHASHEGYRLARSSVRQAIPLEPVWLVEGLGLIQFEETDVHVGPEMTPEGYLRLYTIRKTPDGRHVRVTLLHPRQGTVLQQALYDNQNRLIAFTDSMDHRYFPKRGVALPEKIEMHLFHHGQQAKMVIEASDYQFDSLYGDPYQMWSMPNPQGIETIDLTKIQ